MDVPKCSFCLDINSKRGLMDLNSKLYGLDVTGVPISKVASEVFNFKIIDGFICGICQEELVNAYKFKVNAMKAFEGNSELTKNLEILKSLKDFFDDIESINDVTIMNNHKNIAFIRKNECHKFIRQGWRHESCEDTTIEILEIECNPEQIQEAIESNEEEEEEIHHETSIVGNEEEEETQHEMEDENENLNPEFKDETTYLKCEKETMQSTMNVVTNYTSCNIDYMKSAYVRLERLKSLDSPEKGSTFQDDPSDTMDVEYDLTLCDNEPLDNNENYDSLVNDRNDSNLNETTKNEEDFNSILKQKIRESKVVSYNEGQKVTVWSCVFCKKLCLCGSNLRNHLRKHIIDNQNLKDIKIIEKHENDPKWIAKKVEESTPKDESEKFICCICKKFKTSKKFRLRFHISKIHCFKKDRRTSLDKNDSEQLPKYDYDLDWAEKKIEESKDANESDKWNCVLCSTFSTDRVFGMKIHILRVHCKPKTKKMSLQKSLESSKHKKEKKHEYDPEWMLEMIEKSRSHDDPDSFSCAICNNFSSKSLIGIRVHIGHVHCKPKKKKNVAKTINKNVDMEIEKHDYNIEWIKEITKKSTNDVGLRTKHFLCVLCNNFKTNSSLGFRYHVARVHCKESKTRTLMKAKKQIVKRHYDPEWVNQKIDESKIESDVDKWTCVVCGEFSSESQKSIKLHINAHCIKHPTATETTSLLEQSDDRYEYNVNRIREIVEESRIENECDDEKFHCVVCKDFTTESVLGIRFHVARMHFKAERMSSFERSMSENNGDSEWLKGMIEKSKTPSSSTLWNCCVCDNFSCFSLSAIRKHLITLHCESTSSGSLNHQDDKLQANESISERIRKNWIKNVVNNSEVKKEDGIFWICCICSTTCEGFKETKLHVSRMHRKEMRTETHKLIKEEEDEFENDKVEKCRKRLHTSEEVKNVWICRECGGKICYTEEDFRKHLRVEHMNKFDGTEESTIRNGNKRSLDQSEDDEWVPRSKNFCPDDTENEDKNIASNREAVVEGLPEKKIETKQFEYLHVLPPDMFLSESSEEESDEEIETALVKKEIKEKEEDGETELRNEFISDLSNKDKIWIKRGCERSRKNSYKCWICGKLCKNQMKYHLTRHHLPFYRLSVKRYQEHKKECEKLKNNSDGFTLPKKERTKRNSLDGNNVTGILKCNSCDLKFLKISSFNMHKKIHFISDSIVMEMKLEKCDLCDMQFRNLDDLNYHKNIHKTKGESESIPAEGFCFRSKLKVDSVEVLPHHDEDNWNEICGHCTQKYKSEEDLKRHIMFFHMKPLLCPIDNEQFKKFDDFLFHIHSSHLLVQNEMPVVDNGCLEETSNGKMEETFNDAVKAIKIEKENDT
ncbi:CLUMA_CG015248, isoform A [Clunio marinus]|uniref:CLUMA_CG015248, isoform A n=1 Tax=Clunio marinus TaxID=568069 RepID=A0A1J1IPN3_9DIPT|nr:CLUMA_CG015248, isoform A [Clunio marinus]